MMPVFKYLLFVMLFTISSCTGNIQASSPQEALEGFYQALNAHRCAQTLNYRPDYAAERCRLLDKGSLRFVATPLSAIDKGRQLFEVHVEFQVRGIAQLFDGYVAVIEQNGRWVIDSPSYEYKQNASREDYLARYFPPAIMPSPIIVQPAPLPPMSAPMLLPPPPSVSEVLSPEVLAPEILSAPKHIVVDVDAQQLHLYAGQEHLKTYPVSTALAGEGSEAGSNKTPLGKHIIATKIGADVPERTIFRGRRNTGEIAELNVEGAGDLVTSRILWLRGQEPGYNAGPGVDSYSRYIYIHGTAEENKIGTKASHGCVRMYNHDVIELFDLVEEGVSVEILMTDSAPRLQETLDAAEEPEDSAPRAY
jgi:hypothetical protein